MVAFPVSIPCSIAPETETGEESRFFIVVQGLLPRGGCRGIPVWRAGWSWTCLAGTRRPCPVFRRPSYKRSAGRCCDCSELFHFEAVVEILQLGLAVVSFPRGCGAVCRWALGSRGKLVIARGSSQSHAAARRLTNWTTG